MTPVLCAAESCAIPRRHLDDCPRDPSCRGCLPARAQDGILLCRHCRDGIGISAARLARLYPALEKRLIYRGQAGEYTSGTSTGAPVPDDRVMQLRADIRLVLVDTATLITRRRGVHSPVRRVVRRLPEGVEGPLQLVTVATGNREHLAVFIARHAEWLAAQPEAGQLVDRLWDLSRPGGEAWRAAYSIGPQTLYVGACPLDVSADDAAEPKVCGGRLEQIPDEPLLTCGGCGTSETIEQWERWLFGDGHEAIVDAYAAARSLSRSWMRPVEPSLIRKWAERARREGRELAEIEDDPADPLHPLPKRLGTRVQYQLRLLRQEAERLWGPPVRLGQRAA